MKDDTPSPREAAERAVEDAEVAEGNADNAEALLPGEDPNSRHPEDIHHWLRVYKELLNFKDELLQATDQHLAGVPEEARHDVKIDKVLLGNQRNRYQRRLEWWQAIAKQAEPNGS